MATDVTEDDSPSNFAGEAWTVWNNTLTSNTSNETNNEEKKVRPKGRSDSMKLRKADMCLYGLCPSQDEFYLVMCDKCGHVVKPQALRHHIEQSHENRRKLSWVTSSPVAAKSPSCTPTSRTPSKCSSTSSHSHIPSPNIKPPPTSPTAQVSKTAISNVKKERDKDKEDSRDRDKELLKTLDYKSHIKDESCSSLLKEAGSVTEKTHNKNREQTDKLKCKTENLSERLQHKKYNSDKVQSSDSKLIGNSLSRTISSDRCETDYVVVEKDSAPESWIKKNHSMPVVKVERIASPLAMKKTVSLQPKKAPPTEVSRKNVPCPPSNITHGVNPPFSTSLSKTANMPPTSTKVATVISTTSAHAVTTIANTISVVTTTPASNAAMMSAPPALIELPKREKLLPCKDREFDPNKHCGVMIAELAKQCTRSLTCKTHALSLRRAVKGRRKSFDELLNDHRAQKELMLKAKAAAAAHNKAGSQQTGTKNPGNRKNLHTLTTKTSCQINGVTTVSSVSGPVNTVAPVLPKPSPIAAVSNITKTPKLINAIVQRPPFSPPIQPYMPIEELPTTEYSSRLSSDGDDDEFHDRMECSYLNHHPRPAATCSFGARWNGHFLFNRRQDLIKSAFSQVVEKHLHPPHNKKLCLESKLPQESLLSTDSKDPYDFNFVDTSSVTQLAHLSQINDNKVINRPPKPKQNITKAVKRDLSSSSLRSTILTDNFKQLSHPNKRRRSGSSPCINVTNVNNSSLVPTNPISIAIPAGVKLECSLGSVGSMSSAAVGLDNKIGNNFMKDISLVVTSMDSGIVNGQLINISNTNLGDLTNSVHLQTSLSSALVSRSKMKPNLSKNCKIQHHQNIQDIRANNFFATMPPGTLLMESTTQPGTLIAANPASLGTMTNSITSTTTSSIFRPSSSITQVSTPNGISPSVTAVGVKYVNHLPVNIAVSPASRNSTPSPSKSTSEITTIVSGSGKNVVGRSRTTASSNSSVTAAGFQQVFAASLSSNQYIQPKIHNRTKQSMQMTLPIVAQPNVIVSPHQQHQQQQLLLQAASDDSSLLSHANVIS